jgi:Carboxypeptidase regulatory-like domain
MQRKQLFSVFLLISALVMAQTNRGGISGNVTDQSGSLVPNAAVVIVNTGTNETRRLTTSTKGSFMLENLEPVAYRIEVTAPGFKKAVLDHVKVDTSTVVTADVILQTGDVSTVVLQLSSFQNELA